MPININKETRFIAGFTYDSIRSLTVANKTSFEKIYRKEKDAKVKERILLVLNVIYHGKIAAHVSREIHRNRSWACKWLKRYNEEGIEGLKINQKAADIRSYNQR